MSDGWINPYDTPEPPPAPVTEPPPDYIEPPPLDDPEAEARRRGYSWPEIKDHIGSATATALQHGYSAREIDDFLGRKDPGPFEARARAGWLGSMAGDPSLLETIEPAASPTMREDYADALLAGEVRGPEDFAYRYTAAALDAAHNGMGLDDTNAQAVRERQAEGAFAADALAGQLPSREDLIDAAVALTPVGPTKRTEKNLLDHWLTTGQDPVRAAMQAQNDPELAEKLTATPPEQQTIPLSAFTDPMVEFAKGLGLEISGAGLSIAHTALGIEKWLGQVTGSEFLQREAAKDIADMAQGEAAVAKLLEPNRKDISTFIGRTLGATAGGIAEFMGGGLLPTATVWAVHGADVAYRETGDVAAAALGAAMQGAAAFIPFHLLMGGEGVIQNAVKGVLAMGALGGVQAFADPLPGLVAGHGYQTPTLAQVMEGVAGGMLGGAALGVIGAVRPIRTYDPAKALHDAIEDITPERLIEQAAEQSPLHGAAARYATMEPAERIAALDRDYAPPAEGEPKAEGPTPQELRAQVEELIPSYEASHDMLRYLKGLSADLFNDVGGAMSLYHGTGVVFAAQFGSPFGRFQLQKVGAGEGAQFFSWGLYFAQDPKIAGWYRDADVRRKGTEEGALFTVKVDVEPHQLLDWDTKLGEQPKVVQDAVTKALGDWAGAHAEAMPEMTGEALFKRLMQEKGASVAETQGMTGTANRLASEALLAAGVKGMRYLAGQLSGAAHEGNYNHVIYDPKLISITHRNGEAVRLTPFSLLMPLLEGPVERVGSAVSALTGKFPLRTPEQIVRHHLNEAARDGAVQSIITNVGKGDRTLADFARSLDKFQTLLSPHTTEWEQALASKDPAKMQNTVIGNFIAYVEGMSSGAALGNSKLLPLAQMLRLVNMEMYEKLAYAAQDGRISAPGYIENYFRHLWKDPRGPEWEALTGRYGVGKTGSPQSLKERSVPTTMEGLAAGLVPKIANPIDLAMFDLTQKVRYLASKDIIAQAKEGGFVYHAASRTNPNDVQLRNSEMAVGPNQSVYAWAPAGFAKVYNRWLDAGLYGTPESASRYEKALWMTNTLTGLKLAWPAFHASVVGLGSWAGTFGRAMEEIAHGQLGRAGLDLASNAAVFGPVIVDAVRGTRAIRNYAAMTNDPIIQLLADAGLRFGPRQSVYRFGPESFQQSARRGSDVDLPIVGGVFTKGGMREIFRALGRDLGDIKGDPISEALGYRAARIPDRVLQWPIKLLGRVMNTITDPLFDHAIPAIKVGSAYGRLESWLDQNKTASPEAKWQKARDIAMDVDNRLGELNQDAVFWSKTVKQSGNVALISTGWVYGSYRGFAAAAGVDIERGGWRWNPTASAAVVGTAVGYMYANSLMQYFKTGTFPWDTDTPWQDAFHYRSGGINQWGGPERGFLGSELKEIFDLAKVVMFSIGTGSVSQLGPAFTAYGLAKVNPFFQVMLTLATGMDAVGHHVAFTLEGWFGKNGYLRQLFTPIVVEQMLNRRAGTKISPAEQLLLGSREPGRYVEDPEGYFKSLGKLADRWTKEELSRAGKEALLRGDEPPEGYRTPRQAGGGRGGGGGGTRSAASPISSPGISSYAAPQGSGYGGVADTSGGTPVYRGGSYGGGRRIAVPRGRARTPRPANLLPARLRTKNRRGF